MNMLRLQKLAAVVYLLAGCMAPAWAAGTIYLTANDAAGYSSIISGATWSDSLVPHSDADYLVSSSRYLRTPENAGNYTFNGRSLCTSNGQIVVKGTGIVTIKDLRLQNSGSIAMGIGGPSYFAGTNTVEAIAASPFRIFGSLNRYTFFFSTFKGAGDLLFNYDSGHAAGTYYCVLQGDNSAFTGGMTVAGLSDTKMVVLRASHTNALGGNPATFRADALKLVDTGVLDASLNLTLNQSNRGITLQNSGVFNCATGIVLTISNPVAGTGDLIIRGAGTVVLNQVMTYTGNTRVEGGSLRLGAGLSLPGNSSVVMGASSLKLEGEGSVGNVSLNGGAVNPGTGYGIGTLTVSNLTVNGGTLGYDFGANLTSDNVRVTGTLSNVLATPIPIVLSGMSASSNGVYRLLTAPNLNTFDLADFSLQRPMGIPAGTLELIEEGGVTILIFRQTTAIVSLTASDSGLASSFTGGTRWSDGMVPSSDKDYLVNGLQLRTPSTPASFPGHSLTVAGVAGDFLFKNLETTVPDLRLSGGRIALGLAGSCILSGNASVFATSAAPFRFELEGASATERAITVSATLAGTGDLLFRRAYPASFAYGGSFTLTGSNTGFTGGITVNGSDCRGIELKAAAESNLGGNPTAFRADLLSLVSTGTLFATTSFAIDDPNRGIKLASVGVLKVETNDTLTVCTPVTGDGKLIKRGAGKLVLTGTNTYTGGTSVEAGALEVHAEWALGSNGVSFASNTVFRIPRDAAALPFGVRLGGATPLTIATAVAVELSLNEGESLPGAFEVPLFCLNGTVSLDPADIVPQNIPKGYKVEVLVRSVSVGGTPCTQVYLKCLLKGTLIRIY